MGVASAIRDGRFPLFVEEAISQEISLDDGCRFHPVAGRQ